MMTVSEAIALYESVPSLISSKGDSTAKQRAMACEIVRQADDSWTVQFPQELKVTLPDGDIITKSLSPVKLKSEDLITDTVTIGGVEYPVALAYAINNAVYVKYANPPVPPT